MNFTKEYIKECDCDSIQELKTMFCSGDNFAYKHDKFVTMARFNYYKEQEAFNQGREQYIWLPNGDQLDDEIVKICKNIWSYKIEHYLTWYMKISRYFGDEEEVLHITNSDNPLICKIKLLKQLLKEV